MNTRKRDFEETITAIRGSNPDPAAESAAAERARRGLGLGEIAAASSGEPARIERCSGFQSRIRAYLEGTLPAAEVLLLEDHTRECIPCRRALIAARATRDGARRGTAPEAKATRRPAWGRFAGAAAIAAGVLLIGWGAWWFVRPAPEPLTIAGLRGTLFRIDGASGASLAVGAKVAENERLRTTEGSGAVLVLADGSRIEMHGRTELWVARRRDGETIHLAGGSIIVEAAKQHGGHLDVVTGDTTATVRGTIFNVERGVAGSRVAVLEGTVHVRAGGQDRLLQPGDQMASRPDLAPVPLRAQFGWSTDSARYDELLRELASLRKDLQDSIVSPAPRTDTRLLDSTPAGTVLYAAVPNLTDALDQATRVFDEHLAGSPVLREWWQATAGSAEATRRMDEALARLRAVGKMLGDEIVISFSLDGQGRIRGPLVRAATREPASIEQTLRSEFQKVLHDFDVRVADGIVAAAPSGTIDELESGGTLAGTAFHRRIAAAYADGTGWIFGADLQTILTRLPIGKLPVDSLGLREARHLVVERTEVGPRVHTEAVLTFEGTRRGVASWLAEPGSMGGLDYVSPEATFAASVIVRDPGSAMRELLDSLATAEPSARDGLERFRQETGVDPVADLADPLGGNLTLALDGPLLPVPAWKLVAEVHDPGRLQRTVARIVERANAELHRRGSGVTVTMTEDDSGSHPWAAIGITGSSVEIHWTYDQGWLVAGPSRALVERALQTRAGGVSLASAPSFQELLAASGRTSLSALVYDDTARTIGAIAGAAGAVTGSAGLQGSVTAGERPRLAYAWTEPERIVVASDGEGGLGSELAHLFSYARSGMPVGFFHGQPGAGAQEGPKAP